MSDVITPTEGPDATTVLGAPVSELVLRIHGGERDGQIVRVEADRCSIGSREDCTLRLEAPGVHPVHCFVLRGKHGTVARRWSPDTRLNGRTFRDAYLRGGDRLSIGTVEFEVLCDDESAE